MPNPSARPQRITTAIRVLVAALWLAACSGGGSGGGGGGASGPASPSPASGSSSVTLAWSNASGPVAGYTIYVQRGSGEYKYEADVSQARTTVSGEPGSKARVVVVPYDARHSHGPKSPSSVQFTFPNQASSQGASAASAAASGAATRSLASAAFAPDSAATPEPPPADDPDETPAPDLPGGALVWQAGDSSRLTNAAIETTRMFARPADGAQLAGVADFDADGHGDLLWVSTAAELAYTPGADLRGSDPVSLVDLGTLSAGERVVGAGDFDGDRHGDVLVAAGDAIHARLTAPGEPVVVDLGDSAEAALAGIADFDGNGSDDIAWRTDAGKLVVWTMDEGRATASVEVALAADFGVIAIGDFDGDDRAEVAARDPLGEVFVLHPLDAAPALEATDLANTQGWSGVGAVDFELDRADEVVLATAGSVRFAGLPGDEVVELDPASPWQLIALLP